MRHAWTTSLSLTLAALCLTPGAATQAALPTRLVQAADLVHLGSFTLPAVPGRDGQDGFAYAHGIIAFNPAQQSLFVVGHDWYQQIAEVAIPEIGGVARVRQPLSDAFDGKLAEINPRDPNSKKVGGIHVVGDSLLLTAYSDYDAEHSARASHFVRSVDLAAEDTVRGPIRVGSLGIGFTAGYFTPVPEAWHAALGGPVLNGQCCLNIITRTSYGPSVSAVDPAAILPMKGTARAVALVAYPEGRAALGPWDGDYSDKTPFNGTSRVRGVVLPQGTASVLFFGDQGTGPFCYGDGTTCRDPERTDQGNHAYPYRAQVWAYNAHDLAAVHSGRRRAWDAKPYAVFPLPGVRRAAVGGATVDPTSGRIFVTEKHGDGEKPRIHVYQIAPSAP